jgi:hypothetical protein
MGVRAFGAIASLAVCAAAAVPLQAASSTLPIAGLGASSLCPTPVVSQVAFVPAPTPSDPNPTPVHVTPNAASSGTITVTGTNFTAAGCTPSVVMGSATFGQPAASPETLTIALTPANPMPAAASGAVSVLLTDAVGDTYSSNTGAVRIFNLIQTPAASAQDLDPVEGSTENVTGNAFTPFAAHTHGGLPSTSVVGTYSSCFGRAQQFAASVVASSTGSGNPASHDRALQLPAPSTYCYGNLNLGFTAPYFEDPQPAANAPDCDAPQPQNCIQVSVDADPTAPIDVAFAVSSVAPRSVTHGQTVSVSGSGFGPSGRAAIGGADATVTWNDRSIQVTVPAAASTGHLVVQRLTGDQEALDLGSIAVSATAGALAPAAAGATSASAGPPSAAVAPGAAPPSQSTSGTTVSPASAQDGLTLSASGQASPGTDVPFTVTLTVGGRGISGATVMLSLVSSPDNHASVTPRAAVTDGSGTGRGTLHLSSKPGDHLLLAQSGIYSTEVHVVGQGLASATGGVNLPFGLGPLNIKVNGNALVIWLSVATAILVALGVLVNLEVLRRFLWSISGARLIARWRSARDA